jgi:hypothetical protein
MRHPGSVRANRVQESHPTLVRIEHTRTNLGRSWRQEAGATASVAG